MERSFFTKKGIKSIEVPNLVCSNREMLSHNNKELKVQYNFRVLPSFLTRSSRVLTDDITRSLNSYLLRKNSNYQKAVFDMGLENYKSFQLFLKRTILRLDTWRNELIEMVIEQGESITAPKIESISKDTGKISNKWEHWNKLIVKYYQIISKNPNNKLVKSYQRQSFFLAKMSYNAKGLGPP